MHPAALHAHRGAAPLNENDVITVGRELPKIASVRALDMHRVEVVWSNRPEAPGPVQVDLAPMILRYKVFRPLRDDRALFETVRLGEYGGSIEWGDDDRLALAAYTVETLANGGPDQASAG